MRSCCFLGLITCDGMLIPLRCGVTLGSDEHFSPLSDISCKDELIKEKIIGRLIDVKIIIMCSPVSYDNTIPSFVDTLVLRQSVVHSFLLTQNYIILNLQL